MSAKVVDHKLLMDIVSAASHAGGYLEGGDSPSEKEMAVKLFSCVHRLIDAPWMPEETSDPLEGKERESNG